MPRPVVIGYVHGGTVRAEFCASLLGLTRRHGAQVATILAAHSGPNIAEARNLICRRFLEETDAPWLWMLDTDMVFGPGVMGKLLAAAHSQERPLMGALCYSQDPDGGDPHPTMYELVEAKDGELGFARYRRWPEDAPFRVAATGAACLLIHRDALTAIEPTGEPASPWFRESVLGAKLIGEDLTFCLRAGVARIPVHVHTGVQVGHVKTITLGKVS